jgi:hypothetical protein
VFDLQRFLSDEDEKDLDDTPPPYHRHNISFSSLNICFILLLCPGITQNEKERNKGKRSVYFLIIVYSIVLLYISLGFCRLYDNHISLCCLFGLFQAIKLISSLFSPFFWLFGNVTHNDNIVLVGNSNLL